MKLRMMNKKSPLYQAASKDSVVVAELNEGDEVEFRKVDKKKKDDPWVEVETDQGMKGFLPGKTRMNVVKRVKLLNKSADIYASMSDQSEKVGQIAKGDAVWVFESPKVNGVQWYRVYNAEKVEGYLTSDAKFKETDENPRGSFIRDIINAIILVVLGVILMFVNTNSNTGPWIPILGLATIVFGLARVMMVTVKYLKSK
ncbi:MAG TPA: SH3 domain-containing protein [Longilinea sp.]|nr:SH3 domain-containing protein [Longilinea sp.]